MKVAQVTPKGQILIPKKIREKYGVKPGSRVQILEDKTGILIRPAPEDPIEAACGFLKGDFSLTRDLIEEHRRESRDEKTRRSR